MQRRVVMSTVYGSSVEISQLYDHDVSILERMLQFITC